MGRPLKYKKPRRINVVSVTIVAILVVLGVIAWEYVPLYITKSEAYRVLEEFSSTFAGRDSLYTQDKQARESLRLKMDKELRLAGVDDYEMESWIEVEGKEVRLGVVYSKYIEWPFDIVAKTEELYEIEHTLILD